MTTSGAIPVNLGLADEFADIADAVRSNLSLAVDLVMVHNERPVAGSQPRAALNWSVVLGAMSAWERFVVDTATLFDGKGKLKTDLAQYAGRADALLTQTGAIEIGFLPRLQVRAATNWVGRGLRSMEDLVGNKPGVFSGLTLAQHLNQWVTLRNAIVHHGIARLNDRARDPRFWKSAPQIGDPYQSAFGGRVCLWEFERVRTDPATGGKASMWDVSRHAGCVRGCLATVIQVVDWIIVDISRAFGRDWDADGLRLPEVWFRRDLPLTFRGGSKEQYQTWTLWGGPALCRRA